jgi:hypothetical protein
VRTINLSVRGAKVRSQEILEAGVLTQLFLELPDDDPLAVSAIVWRADPDGLAFFFIDDIPGLAFSVSRAPGRVVAAAGAAVG